MICWRAGPRSSQGLAETDANHQRTQTKREKNVIVLIIYRFHLWCLMRAWMRKTPQRKKPMIKLSGSRLTWFPLFLSLICWIKNILVCNQTWLTFKSKWYFPKIVLYLSLLTSLFHVQFFAFRKQNNTLDKCVIFGAEVGKRSTDLQHIERGRERERERERERKENCWPRAGGQCWDLNNNNISSV